MPAATDGPIACTLGTDELDQRLAWIRRVTEHSLVSHQVESATLRLTYRSDALHDLQQIVAKERECYAFLLYALEPSADAVRLTIRAPDGVSSQARWLFEQILPMQPFVAARKVCGCAPGACG